MVAKHHKPGRSRLVVFSGTGVPPKPWYNGSMAGSIFPGLDGTAGKEAADPAYLSDPSFAEENAGPLIEGRWRRSQQRDPSPSQIRRRAEAIRRAYPRPAVGESAEPWTPPEIEAPADFDIAKVA